jgi:precorrin-8X/cobalt-precorrin-8 methylmutase
LTPLVNSHAALPSDAAGIERRSYEIIDRQLGDWGPADPGARQIIRRVVHATADVSFARSLRIHPQAVERGRAALAAGKPILCDVRMLQAGMTKTHSEILCAIARPEAAALAQARGSTRAAAAIELLSPQLDGAIVAIGNAPTALWKVLELARQGGPRPALVVGLPVGLVGARESKQALLESDLCYITNVGSRGGSPVAAAAVNALATLER